MAGIGVLPIYESRQRPDIDLHRCDLRVLIYRSRLIERSETFVVDHYDGLTELDVECAFACDELIGKTMGNYRIFFNRLSEGGRIRRLFRKTLFNLLPLRSRIHKQIEKFSPDIIHAHFATDAAEILPVARRLGVPLVTTFHGVDITSTESYYWRKFPFKWPYVLRRRQLVRSGALFLAVSKYLESVAISKGYPKEKVRTHYLGTKIPARLPDINTDRQGILFVARLVEKKGCHYLIEAFRKLRAEGLQERLTIIGDGPERGRVTGACGGSR